MGSYMDSRFTNNIKKERISTIVECGSRDCVDAIALNDYYHPSIIYSFECNPESIAVCKKNIEGISNIKLIDKAVYNDNRVIDFYATDMEKSIDKNIGASSILYHRDNDKEFFQKKVQVEAIRLDSFMKQEDIDIIDLLCMDLQGAELIALKGLGDRIHHVRYIIVEVSFQSYYYGDRLFEDIDEYLVSRFFRRISQDAKVKDRHTGFANCLYKNKKL